MPSENQNQNISILQILHIRGQEMNNQPQCGPRQFVLCDLRYTNYKKVHQLLIVHSSCSNITLAKFNHFTSVQPNGASLIKNRNRLLIMNFQAQFRCFWTIIRKDIRQALSFNSMRVPNKRRIACIKLDRLQNNDSSLMFNYETRKIHIIPTRGLSQNQYSCRKLSQRKYYILNRILNLTKSLNYNPNPN